MAISLSSLRTSGAPTPPRVLLYGVHGVGKTTFASSAPSPVFLQTEDGLGSIEAQTFGLLKSYDELMQAIGALYTEEHDFKTVVLDSIDWTENLVWAETCKANGWKSVEDAGYGKGYIAALDAWRMLIDGLNALRDEKGMSIVLIAHADVRRHDAPDTEPYDRYVIKLHKGASALVQEHVDVVAFCNYRVSIAKADVGFNKRVTRGVSSGERLLHLSERPAYLAKNRFSMPDTMPMDWGQFSAAIPYFNQGGQL